MLPTPLEVWADYLHIRCMRDASCKKLIIIKIASQKRMRPDSRSPRSTSVKRRVKFWFLSIRMLRIR